MRHSHLATPGGRMGIATRFTWDDRGTPTLMLSRRANEAAISLNDAHVFRDTPEAWQYAARIASALGLDYWSNLDRAAVLDTVYRNIDQLVHMPPEPLDGLRHRRDMIEGGVAHATVRANGRTIMEEGL